MSTSSQVLQMEIEECNELIASCNDQYKSLKDIHTELQYAVEEWLIELDHLQEDFGELIEKVNELSLRKDNDRSRFSFSEDHYPNWSMLEELQFALERGPVDLSLVLPVLEYSLQQMTALSTFFDRLSALSEE